MRELFIWSIQKLHCSFLIKIFFSDVHWNISHSTIFSGSSITDFMPQLRNFNKDMFSLIAWDPPGYGKSYPPSREWVDNFLHEDAKIAARLMEVCTVCCFVHRIMWSVLDNDEEDAAKDFSEIWYIFISLIRRHLCWMILYRFFSIQIQSTPN